VVIVSLVRSNPAGTIGFLRMANRVNVLLSRAKHGLFLIGNAWTLTAKPERNIWPAIIDTLKAREQVMRSCVGQSPIISDAVPLSGHLISAGLVLDNPIGSVWN
jgi:hypothetical protein